MKKQITIIGIQHKSGTSKSTQKPYDFYLLHATYADPDTEGLATLSVVVPDCEVPTLVVGENVTLFSHFYQGKECVDAILR